jgi:hypothetical protein
MAFEYRCDGGCGVSTGDLGQLETFGFVRERSYCPDCAEVVRGYVRDRDDAHTKIALEWEGELDHLRNAFLRTLPEGELPDE